MSLIKDHKIANKVRFSKEGRQKKLEKFVAKQEKAWKEFLHAWANPKLYPKESRKTGRFGRLNKSIPEGYNFSFK